MGRDDDARSEGVEFHDEGPQTPADERLARAPSGWVRWLPVLLAGVVAAAVIFAIVQRHDRTPSAAPSPTPSRGTSATVGTAPAPGSAVPSTPPIAVTDVHHPILGVTANWELFARGDTVLLRIQLAQGRITRTSVPALGSNGPVSFLVTGSQAIIRPIDFVPGYVVPNGQPARPATGALSTGGPVLPGPDPEHVWSQVQSANDSSALMMLTPAGSSASVVPIPADISPLAVGPDGAGYLLIPTTSGTLDARPDGTRPITTGSVVAAGTTGWLVLECAHQAQCVNVVVDRATGARRTVDVRPVVRAPGGVISPDGRTAAVLTVGTDGPITVSLVDLSTGRARPMSRPVELGPDSQTIAWSPDSRWLFAAQSDGTVAAIHGDSGQVTDLGVRLPSVHQLAVRGARS